MNTEFTKTYEKILSELSKNGGRITQQRRQIIRVILENPNCTCKELYYLSRQKDNKISRATVYRTVSTLENLGYISRQNIILK